MPRDRDLRLLRLDWPAAATWLDTLEPLAPGSRRVGARAHAEAVRACDGDLSRLGAVVCAVLDHVTDVLSAEDARRMMPGSLRRVLGIEGESDD